MRRKKDRPSSTPLKWTESATPTSDPAENNPVPHASYYKGTNPLDYPLLGKKEGPRAIPSKPFPLCLGLAKDPNKGNASYFNDTLCLNFISNLHQLLSNQGRLNDVIQILEGLKEKPKDGHSTPISAEAFEKQLGEAAKTWNECKFGRLGPGMDSVTTKCLFTLFQAVYDFKGDTNPIMQKICSPARQYQSWYMKPPAPCDIENCPATFDTTSDLIRLGHRLPERAQPKSNKEGNGAQKFKCQVCDITILHRENDIREHLQIHHLSTARYALNHLQMLMTSSKPHTEIIGFSLKSTISSAK